MGHFVSVVSVDLLAEKGVTNTVVIINPDLRRKGSYFTNRKR
jgi:hypothetical protein